MTLTTDSLSDWSNRLKMAGSGYISAFPGERPDRQPVHTVYGGAHLFKASTAARLGQLALASLDEFAGGTDTFAAALGMDDPALSSEVRARVVEKLSTEPVEDFRLDFEDGYGSRPDDEEDAHAQQAAREVAKGLVKSSLPPFVGMRVKPLSSEAHHRSLRTLDLFLTELWDVAAAIPSNFVVTLPKITSEDQVAVLAEAISELESSLGIRSGAIAIELMMETPQMVVGPDGLGGVRRFVEAGDGRVVAVHFGTYDYTASLSITAAYQTMTHPVCDFARHVQQVSVAGTGIWLSDGATNVMPVPVHRGEALTGEQVAENLEAVHAAWRLHYSDVRSSLYHGYYQGWDLHPAQLPTRYAAIFSFFLEGLDTAGVRLSNFVDQAARATLVGDIFDDAATGQGLLNYFLRAINCGAISESEAQDRTGLTLQELETRSFPTILAGRQRRT